MITPHVLCPLPSENCRGRMAGDISFDTFRIWHRRRALTYQRNIFPFTMAGWSLSAEDASASLDWHANWSSQGYSKHSWGCPAGRSRHGFERGIGGRTHPGTRWRSCNVDVLLNDGQAAEWEIGPKSLISKVKVTGKTVRVNVWVTSASLWSAIPNSF